MDDDQKYIRDSIEEARPTGEAPYGDTFRIQVRSEAGKTHWLSIPAARFDAVRAAASGTEGLL